MSKLAMPESYVLFPLYPLVRLIAMFVTELRIEIWMLFLFYVKTVTQCSIFLEPVHFVRLPLLLFSFLSRLYRT